MTIYVVHYAIYYVVHYVLCSTLEKTLMPGKIGGKRRRGQKRVKWLDGITDTTDMTLRKLQKIVKNREAWILQCMGLQSQTWTTNVMHLLNIVYQLSLQKAFLPWNYYNLLILSILKIVLFICVSNSYNFYILKDRNQVFFSIIFQNQLVNSPSFCTYFYFHLFKFINKYKCVCTPMHLCF